MQADVKRSQSAPKTVGKSSLAEQLIKSEKKARETDSFGYPIRKAVSREEAMKYLGIRDQPRPVVAQQPKDEEVPGEVWVKKPSGLYVMNDKYSESRDKPLPTPDSAGARKEIANAKGIKTDIFGYPEAKSVIKA